MSVCNSTDAAEQNLAALVMEIVAKPARSPVCLEYCCNYIDNS